MSIAIKILMGDQPGEVYFFEQEQVVVGRSESCDIRFACDELSRRHCAFSAAEEQSYLEDYGSENGTFLNGKKIEGKEELSYGDVVDFGSIKIQFCAPNKVKVPVGPKKKASTTIIEKPISIEAASK